MFAAGSPKDGAVDIIGGNQSGKVSRGRIQLTKIDYVRRASESVVVQQPINQLLLLNQKLPPPLLLREKQRVVGSFLVESILLG